MEPKFTTQTFKNSHFNTAHYNNPNFHPEEYRPEPDELMEHVKSSTRKKSNRSMHMNEN